jgi:hypothetical protein
MIEYYEEVSEKENGAKGGRAIVSLRQGFY